MRSQPTPPPYPVPPTPFEASLRRMLAARHGAGIAAPSAEIERLLAEWPQAKTVGEA